MNCPVELSRDLVGTRHGHGNFGVDKRATETIRKYIGDAIMGYLPPSALSDEPPAGAIATVFA